MSLRFPVSVPKASRQAVVAAQATAEISLREALRKPVSSWDGQEHCVSYLSTVVFALATELCSAARIGALSVDDIGECIEEFLRTLTAQTYYDFGLEGAWSGWESFRDEMSPAIFESDRWREHLRERAAVAADWAGDASTNSPDSSLRSSSTDNDKPSGLAQPLAERERLSLLRIIRALAKEEKPIDISHATSAAEVISALTAEIDEDKRVAVTTIARHLRRIQKGI